MLDGMTYADPLSSVARVRLTAAIEALSTRLKVKPYLVSQIISNDAKLYSRIATGGGFTVQTYDRVMGTLSAVWPPLVEWPWAVPRPAPLELNVERHDELTARMASLLAEADAQPQEEAENG